MNRFLLFLATVPCWAYSSLSVPAGAYVRMMVPNVAAFSSEGDYRIEFRMHGWTLPSSGNVAIFQVGRVRAHLYSNAQLCVNHTGDSMSWGSAECVSLTGTSDIVVRTQRMGAQFPVHDPMPGSTWTEVQDLASGQNLAYACGGWASGCPVDVANNVSVAGTSSGFGATVGFSLAWLKWFSTTVPPGSPFDNETTPADLADWRFEGVYSDQGLAGLGITLAVTSGSPTFRDSPVHAPACRLSREIFRAGTEAQLGHSSYALDGTASPTLLWQQLSGPTRLTWQGRTTDRPIVTGSAFGTYIFQLSVRDGSGQQSTCVIKDGFVATDENDIVVNSDPRLDSLLGPQVRLGKNPWSWFDDRHVAEAAMQTANLSTYYGLSGTPPWNTAGAGTIAVTNNSTTVTGTGTTFTTTFCQGPGNPTLPKSGGAVVEVWYPNAAVPGGTGRRAMWVSSCASETSLTLSQAWNSQGFLTAGSGWSYSFVDGNLFNTWIANVAPANFYDVVAAYYSLYYRSGIDDYLITARLLADNFWVFRLDSGRNYFYGEGRSTFPRNMNILGMVLRALDGRPDMWSGLELIAGFQASSLHAQFQSWGNWTQIGGGSQGGSDPREEGYMLMQIALCGAFDPNATPASTCRSNLSEVMTRGWTAAMQPDGYWYSHYWGGSGGGGGSQNYASWTQGTAVTLTNGSSTGTCAGSCLWSPDKFTVDVNGQQVAQVWGFPYNPSVPLSSNTAYFPTAYYPLFVDATHFTLRDISGATVTWQDPACGGGAGGAACNYGWAVGNMSRQIGYGVRPYMYGILGTAFDLAARAMTCTEPGVPTNCDATVAANAHAYNVHTATFLKDFGYWASAKGQYYGAKFLECTPPVSDTNVGCTGGNDTGQARLLNAEALRSVMTAYAFNGDPQLRSFGDTLYNAMWGKPGFSAGGGMTSDGKYVSGYDDGYGYFMYGTPPAGQAHKYFGMGWGIGAGSAWPGYRLGGAHTGAMVSSSIAVAVSLVPGASSFNLLVTYPTGATATIHCAASPCPAAFDQLQGNPSIQIQYLSASGTALATQPYPFAISVN